VVAWIEDVTLGMVGVGEISAAMGVVVVTAGE